MTQPQQLFTYQCSLCKTLMVSVIKVRYRPCNGCLRWMKFLYAEPITTDKQREIAAKGTVYNPYLEPTPWDCVRCGVTFTDIQPRYRPDGKCCRACVASEGVPPLATVEEMLAADDRINQLIRDDQERHERAYQEAEGHSRHE